MHASPARSLPMRQLLLCGAPLVTQSMGIRLAIALGVLTGIFAMDLHPAFLRTLADPMWACF